MSEEKKAQQPQGFYARPAEENVEECPSCFYQPAAAAAKKDTEKMDEHPKECPSCFYQPGAVEEPQVDEADCPSCFYQPAAKSED